MKTNIRINTTYTRLYDVLNVQLIGNCIKLNGKSNKNSLSFSGTIGFLNFQKIDGVFKFVDYETKTKCIESLQAFTKLAKHIEKQLWCGMATTTDSLKDVLEIIGAVEHVIFDHCFVKVSDNGKYIFSLMSGDDLYIKFVAKDVKEAEKWHKKNFPTIDGALIKGRKIEIKSVL